MNFTLLNYMFYTAVQECDLNLVTYLGYFGNQRMFGSFLDYRVKRFTNSITALDIDVIADIGLLISVFTDSTI